MAEDTLTIAVEFTAGASYAELPMFVEFTFPEAEELAIDLEFDGLAQSAGIEPSPRAGVKLYVDGNLIPQSLLAIGSLTESLDGDADQFTFARVGRDMSPWLTRWLQESHEVEAYLVLGAPGFEYEQRMFSGIFTSSSFDGQTGEIAALDRAISVSQIQASLSLAPNHGDSMREIITALCDAYGIDVEMDLGDVGEEPRSKPIQQAEVGLLELISSVASPACARVWYADDVLQVRRLDFEELSVREIFGCDLVAGSFGLTLPAAASKNKITAVTVRFSEKTLVLVADPPQVVEVESVYARAAAVLQRDSVGDTVVDYSETPVNRVTERITTKRWRMGTTVVRTETWRQEFMARPVADRQIETDGTINNRYPPIGLGNYYFMYADGNWYEDAQEVFRVTSVDVDRAVLDGLDIVGNINEHYGWHWLRQPIYNEATDAFIGITPIPLNQEGIGVMNGSYYFGDLLTTSGPHGTVAAYEPLTRTTEEFVADSDGFVTSRTEETQGWSAGPELGIAATYGYSYDSERTVRYLYGVDDLRTIETVEDLYDFDESKPQNGYQLTSVAIAEGGTPVATSSTGDVRPHLDRLESESDSQEMRVEAVDEVRVALNGEQVDQIHTEFAETEEELNLVALDAVRTAGAWRISLSMPIEHLIRKGMWFTLTLNNAELGIGSIRLWCTDVTRNFSSYTQDIQALYFPEELAS